MDITIEIPNPVLIGTEYFIVRYRELPSGLFVDFGSQTNAPFTITGLSNGTYELEVRTVNEDGIICPAVTKEFVIQDPPPDYCECPTVSNLSVTRRCDNTALIHFDLGTPVNACGLTVTYSQFGGIGNQTTFYPTPPSFLDLVMPDNASTTPPSLTVVMNCCTGDNVVCFDGPIHTIVDQDCGCVSPYISSAWLNYEPGTDIYTLCINFISAVGVDHNIYYKQLNTTSPSVFDEGNIPTITDGYFEVELDYEPFAGSIEYYVKVTNLCGEDFRNVVMHKCGELAEFGGGQSYPTVYTIEIAPYLSQVISIDPASVPDKFVIEIAGVEQLNTGYIGNTSYQALLDAALIALGDPPETITVPASPYAFSNPTGAQYMQLKVFGPLENTSWQVVPECAEPPLGDVITLIVENTAESNVQTTQVHGVYAIPGSTINFMPYQDPDNEDTFINQPGWTGSISAGVLLKPIVAESRVYKVEVFQNGFPITFNTYSYGGSSIFHLPVNPSGIMNGDTVRIKISS